MCLLHREYSAGTLGTERVRYCYASDREGAVLVRFGLRGYDVTMLGTERIRYWYALD